MLIFVTCNIYFVCILLPLHLSYSVWSIPRTLDSLLCTTTQRPNKQTEDIESEPRFLPFLGFYGYMCLFLQDGKDHFPESFPVGSFSLVQLCRQWDEIGL